MSSKMYLCLTSTLLLRAGLFLGLATLIPKTEARIASNGVVLNSTSLKVDSASTAQLRMEGGQLVLHLRIVD